MSNRRTPIARRIRPALGWFTLLLVSELLLASEPQSTTQDQLLGSSKRLTFSVVERLPMPAGLFVQGLEFHGDDLYISTGKYGESRLLHMRFPTLEMRRGRKLSDAIFAEGLTIHGDTLYQLTWRAGAGLRFDLETLDFISSFPLPGQGWGICSDGEQLVYSDGSATLRFLSLGDQRITDSVEVTLAGQPLLHLNELECHRGSIWANVWRTDQVVEIDPQTGEVRATLDLTELYPQALRPAGVDVLNGIAFDQDDRLWVTGKYWPWIYRLELQSSSP